MGTRPDKFLISLDYGFFVLVGGGYEKNVFPGGVGVGKKFPMKKGITYFIGLHERERAEKSRGKLQ